LEQDVINIFKPKKDENDKKEGSKDNATDYKEDKQPEVEWIKADLQELVDAMEANG